MEINNWKYNDNSDNEDLKFEIIPPDSIKKIIPETLFKYYALNCNSLDALENNYIYAPDRWQLNDPFDCHKNLIDFIDLTPEDIQQLTNHYEDTNIKIITTKLYYQFYNFFGIISMTDNPENTLMWAHYANNNGFVVEYDYKNFDKKFFLGPFQINYNSNLQPVLSKAGQKNETFLYHTNVKNDTWKYESEWRLIAFKKEAMHLPGIGETDNIKSNRKFSCKGNIKSFTLGCNFFDLKNELIPLKESGESHVAIADKKLRVINYVVENGVELFWISPPDFHQKNDFNLQRRKIEMKRINENKFKLTYL